MSREMKAQKFEIAEVLDEDGQPVTCVFKSRHGDCNELPDNIAFGVLCRRHLDKVDADFASWRRFLAREREKAQAPGATSR